MTRYRWTYADGREQVFDDPAWPPDWITGSQYDNPVVRCEALPEPRKIAKWRVQWDTDYSTPYLTDAAPPTSWWNQGEGYAHLVSCVRVEVDAEETQ